MVGKNRILTDAAREIRNTFSRFLSLFLLSALAVAFLAGLRSTRPDMEHTADRYYDRTHLMDVRILSTLGLTDEDIDVLAAFDGVEKAEGAWFADGILRAGSAELVVRAHSLSEQGINDPELLAGRLPAGDDECLAESVLLAHTGLHIGDTLTLDVAGTDYEDILDRTSFTIVGECTSPLYLSTDRGTSSVGTGRLTAVLFVPRSAFSAEAYTEAYLLADGASDLWCYDDDYDELTDGLIDRLEVLGEDRAGKRYDDVIGEATDKLDDAQREFDDAEAEARQELADARAELEDARKKLDDGWRDYYRGRRTLDQEIQKGRAELTDARKKLDDGYKDLETGRAELARQLSEGRAELERGRAELTASRTQLDAARIQYEQGYALYTENRAEVDAARAELENAEALFAQALAPFGGDLANVPEPYLSDFTAQRAALDAAYAELAAGEAPLAAAAEALAGAKAELDDGEARYAEGLAKYEQGLAELETQEAAALDTFAAAEAELAEGEISYTDGVAALEKAEADGRAELRRAYRDLTDGEDEYEQGLADYAEGEAEAETELADARRKLNDARREISEIEQCDWYVLGRNTNSGYVSYGQDAQRMGNLASVFPLIFFLVAALVCLTTMTRMVEEQRIQIGGLKALGYGRAAIAWKYVGYGLLSSLFGGLTGLAVGCTLLPTIIFNAWKAMYTVGDLRLELFPGISALAVGAAVVCVTGTALLTCLSALRSVPAALMRPKSPQAGKRVLLERVGFLWKRLSFSWKVSIRNLLRYQKRFWMTVIGIGGCTALIIAGFGLRDAIHDTFDKQYLEITAYDAQVALLPDLTDDELTELARELDGSSGVAGWMPLSSLAITAESDRRSIDSSVYLFAVTDEELFTSFVDLRERVGHADVSLERGGAVLTEKLTELLDLGVGDSVTLVDGDGKRVSVPVTGIAENYVFHYAYLDRETYLDLYGEEPPVNTLMVRFTDDSEETADRVCSSLIRLSGVSSIARTSNVKDTVSQGLQGVDYAVIVVVVAAAALAFVVLYNLTNINITERLRELATLKVLGFTDAEMTAYVSRENVFLTLFGIALGLVLGKYLHQWLVLTVEIDIAMFGRTAKPMSYVYSVVLTVLFSVLVNLAAHRKMKKIDMVESLKTVE